MRNILVEMTPSSCYHAKQKLDAYARREKDRLDEVCRRLAEIGAREASSVVAGIRTAEGNTDVRVEAKRTDNGWKIVMEGQDVYFIEFGTGDGVSAHYDTSVPVAWGTWSAEHKQVLWTRGFWYYDKVRFTGTPAYMPMYYAEKKMREEMPKVIQEVYGK